MQHSRLPNFPPLFSSFRRHRSSVDQSRFRLDLTLPKPIAVPVWASLPTPPMSGSPPPEPPSDPPQIAGRRRKRSETPPTNTALQTTSPETQVGASTGGAIVRARAGQLGGDVLLQAAPYSTSYPPQPPQGSYGAGSSSMGAITASPFETRFPAGPVSPRTTRKTKAHVASACVNCKKKHLRCDNARPCHRCTQSGKEVRKFVLSTTRGLTFLGFLCGRRAQKARSAATEARRAVFTTVIRLLNGPAFWSAFGSGSTYADSRSKWVWRECWLRTTTFSTAATHIRAQSTSVAPRTTIPALRCTNDIAKRSDCHGNVCAVLARVPWSDGCKSGTVYAAALCAELWLLPRSRDGLRRASIRKSHFPTNAAASPTSRGEHGNASELEPTASTNSTCA